MTETVITRADAKEARVVVLSSAIGTTVEFFDFNLYGLAAGLVFGPQFFGSSGLGGQLAALATFAVGFILRPLGGIIAGHLGDRVGRKRVMIWSFAVMGIGTLLIAFLPTYTTIGIAAPILLVLLRGVQGLAAGAEWSGAALMAVEHAPANKRGLYGTAPSFGTTAGALLATAVFTALSTFWAHAFTEYAWRIAFGLSIFLVIFGLVVRRRVTESPIFEEAAAKKPVRVPLAAVVTRHPISVLRAMSWVMVTGATGYVVQTVGVAYSTKSTGAPEGRVLLLLNLALLFAILAILVVGRLVDRYRRPVLITVALFQIPAAILLFPLMSTGSLVAVMIAFSLVWLGVGMIECTRGYVLSDLFPANVRYTGLALSYNLAYVVAGLMPLATAAIVGNTGSYAGVVAILGVLALLAVPTAFMRPRGQIAGNGDAD